MTRSSFGPGSHLGVALLTFAIVGCGGSVLGAGTLGDDAGFEPGTDGGPVQGTDSGAGDDDGGHIDPACPVPSMLVPGAACGGPVGQACASNNVLVVGCGDAPPSPTSGTCTCTAQGWNCPQIALACAPPAPTSSTGPSPTPPAPTSSTGPSPTPPAPTSPFPMPPPSPTSPFPTPPPSPTSPFPTPPPSPTSPFPMPPSPPSVGCPRPHRVRAYAPCEGEGLSCPGNPQFCDGQVFYDAFECQGEWIPIATTVCERRPGRGVIDPGFAVP